jgi:hypothetical protein
MPRQSLVSCGEPDVAFFLGDMVYSDRDTGRQLRPLLLRAFNAPSEFEPMVSSTLRNTPRTIGG